jgi:hypothetical protein
VLGLGNPKRPSRLVLEAFAGPKVRQLEIWLEQRRLASLALEEGWRQYGLELPRLLGADRLSIRLESESWVPDEVHGNGDLRRLGVALRRIELLEAGR